MSCPDTVLIVDDDAATIKMLSLLVQMVGVRSLSADRGEKALEILHQEGERIGLVLLDIAMPGMDGFAVCRAIRQDPFLRDLPVIAITARSCIEIDDNATAAGFNQIISKPFEPELLRSTVSQYLPPCP